MSHRLRHKCRYERHRLMSTNMTKWRQPEALILRINTLNSISSFWKHLLLRHLVYNCFPHFYVRSLMVKKNDWFSEHILVDFYFSSGTRSFPSPLLSLQGRIQKRRLGGRVGWKGVPVAKGVGSEVSKAPTREMPKTSKG